MTLQAVGRVTEVSDTSTDLLFHDFETGYVNAKWSSTKTLQQKDICFVRDFCEPYCCFYTAFGFYLAVSSATERARQALLGFNYLFPELAMIERSACANKITGHLKLFSSHHAATHGRTKRYTHLY